MNIFISGFYIPNDGSVKGKGGVVYAKDGGFCLETEVYPDSVNQKSFPCDSILRPGQVYDHRVTYKFFDFWLMKRIPSIISKYDLHLVESKFNSFDRQNLYRFA